MLLPRSPDLARRVFSPIATNYDRPAVLLSLLQYRRWHRFLLARLDTPATEGQGHGTRVLDMATGTGMLAFALLQQPGTTVVGADITRAMLLQARAKLPQDGRRLNLVECSAQSPPFQDAAFDAVVFAYLLRYVDDVAETLRRMGRLVKRGGVMASLDFAIPRGLTYPAWRFYTGFVLPLAGMMFSRWWRQVASFLGPSIRDFYRAWPEDDLLDAWRRAGFPDVQAARLSLGGAIVMWGRKEG